MTTLQADDRMSDNEPGQGLLALQVVIGSGVLGGNDLELLALVSKDLNRDATNDVVWKHLCATVHPCISLMDAEMMDRASYRGLYWQWSAPPMARVTRSLPSPSCKAEDLAIFVSIYDVEGGHANCIKIRGRKLEVLLDEGEVTCRFKDPSRHVVDRRGRRRPRHFWATVHMFRYSDMSLCSICDHRGMWRDTGDRTIYDSFARNYFVFRDTKLGHEIQCQLGHTEIYFDVCLKFSGEESSREFKFSGEENSQEFLEGVVLTARQQHFGRRSDYHQAEHRNVTLLHFLSGSKANRASILLAADSL
jgi:hypothetical protein